MTSIGHPYHVFVTCWPNWPISGRRSRRRVGALVDLLPSSPQILRRRFLPTIVTETTTKPSRSPYMSSSIYGTVVFDLTLFNEVTKSDNVLKNIDSCIKVIIEMPDIRSHRLVHRIPSYFDSTDPTYLVPPQGNSQTKRY